MIRYQLGSPTFEESGFYKCFFCGFWAFIFHLGSTNPAFQEPTKALEQQTLHVNVKLFFRTDLFKSVDYLYWRVKYNLSTKSSIQLVDWLIDLPRRRQTRLTALDIVAFMLGAFSTVVPSVTIARLAFGTTWFVLKIGSFPSSRVFFCIHPFWKISPLLVLMVKSWTHQPLRSADPDEDPKQFCKLEPHELECAGLGGRIFEFRWVQSC